MLCKRYTWLYGREALLFHRLANKINFHQLTSSTSNDEPGLHRPRQRYSHPPNSFFRHIRMAMNNESPIIESQSNSTNGEWPCIHKTNSDNDNTFAKNYYSHQHTNELSKPSSTSTFQQSHVTSDPSTSLNGSSRSNAGPKTGSTNSTNRKSNLWTSTLSKSINWFYNQSAIDIAATKVSIHNVIIVS